MRPASIKKILNQCSHYDLIISSFIVIGCLLLQVIWLPEKELWLDETHSALLSGKSFQDMLLFIKGDVHPPLYFALLWVWSNIFGNEPIVLKSFSVFITTITCFLFIYISRNIGLSKPIAIITTSLFVFSPVLFWYSIEARMYSLRIRISVLILIYVEKVTNKSDNKKHDIFLLGILLALLFYTHYTAIFYIFGLFFWSLYLIYKRQIDYKLLLTVGIVFLILTSPWIPVVKDQVSVKKTELGSMHYDARRDENTIHYDQNVVDPSPISKIKYLMQSSVENIASVAGVYPAKNSYLQIITVIPFLVIFVVFSKLLLQKEDTILLTTIIGISVIAGSFLLGLGYRRYVILLAPLFVLSFGKCLAYLSNKNIILASFISIALMVASISGVLKIFNKTYYTPTIDLVNTLNAEHKKGELVVIQSMHGEIPIDYYLDVLDVDIETTGFPLSIHDWWMQQSFKGWGSPVVTNKNMNTFVDNITSESSGNFWVILFEVENYDKNYNFINLIKSKAKKFTRKSIKGDSMYASKYQLYYIEI